MTGRAFFQHSACKGGPNLYNTTTLMSVSEQYFIIRNNETYGPYSVPQLQQMLAVGDVKHTDYIWQEGMAERMPLSFLPGLYDTPGEKLPGLYGFSITAFFSEVFKRHSTQDIEECFSAGTSRTTPTLSEVGTTWPTPWIFSRMFVVCLLLYFGFNWAATQFENPLLIPGLLFVGNFGIPFCLFVLFYEMNVRRDVSIYSAGVMMVTGSLLSLIFSLILFAFWKGEGSVWAGPIEESAKLIAVLLVAHRMCNGRILTGLLLGAAIGAGFAAFESAGYTFMHLRYLIVYHTAADVLSNFSPAAAAQVQQVAQNSLSPGFVMEYRALLTAAAGHTQWTAITAGAYWLVWSRLLREGTLGGKSSLVNMNVILDWRFWKIAIIPILVHMFWNSPLLDTYPVLKVTIAAALSWAVVLKLVAAGLTQVREQKLQLDVDVEKDLVLTHRLNNPGNNSEEL